MKKDILKNARIGTRIYNAETNTYYIKNRKGTWQKADSFFGEIGTRIGELSAKESPQGIEHKRFYANTIGEDGSFDFDKKIQGFTITNDHPIAEKLRSSEKVRVNVRKELAIKKKESEEASILANKKANINKIITSLENKETVNIQGAFFNPANNPEQTQTYITEYQEKLKELDKPKTIKGKNESTVKPERSSFYFTDKYEKNNDVDPETKKVIDQGKDELQKLFGVQL